MSFLERKETIKVSKELTCLAKSLGKPVTDFPWSKLAPQQEPQGSVYQFSSVTQSCPTLCDRMDCSTPAFSVLSPTPRAYSDSCPLSRWCHPTISSSVVPFSSRLQAFPYQESRLKSLETQLLALWGFHALVMPVCCHRVSQPRILSSLLGLALSLDSECSDCPYPSSYVSFFFLILLIQPIVIHWV